MTKEEKEAYNAGKDALKNGANTINCNLKFFSHAFLIKAWEKGNKYEKRFLFE